MEGYVLQKLGWGRQRWGGVGIIPLRKYMCL